ncbi:heavy metal-binding protein HIP-like [Mercenaria mercenaria]|uniref:heavy metal-binding protein HIP-like n=1 Tax=Mercenaria mercenaria TaxID=6596 RepID=UPI00234F4B66|nr:heavy metal-binding protein HIP-like [Mercenaria mercenaria]
MQSILLICIMLVAPCCTEPHCSKFHYEESLLEKMIRTEILVQNMKKEIGDIQNQVRESLANLKEETNTWKTEIETLQENSKTKLAELSEKASSELDKNMQKVDDLKGRAVLPNVVFNAKKVINDSPGSGNTIVFTEIILNLGEAYSPDTGVFTAPHGGTYLITVQLCVDGSKYIDYGLVVDEVYMNVARYQDNHAVVCCYGSTTTVSLKPGSKVWVKVVNRSSSGTLLYGSNSNYWNTFTGVLIRVD